METPGASGALVVDLHALHLGARRVDPEHLHHVMVVVLERDDRLLLHGLTGGADGFARHRPDLPP